MFDGFGWFGGLGQLLQLVHVVPPLVGLVLVARIRTRRRWRTWALASFGLSVVTAVLSVLVTLGLVYGYRSGMTMSASSVLLLLNPLLTLLSLTAAGLGVAAVVADRAADAPVGPAPQA